MGQDREIKSRLLIGRFILLVLLLVNLFGCGGGGGNGTSGDDTSGGGSGDGVVPPDQQEIIADAGLYAESDLSNNQFTIYWTDTLTDEIGYRVEMTSDAISPPSRITWAELEFLTPSPGTGSQYSWSTDITGDSWYRVVAVRPGGDYLLATESGKTSVMMSSTISVEVVVSGTDPRSGILTIQVLATGFSPISVEYFLDLVYIGSGSGDEHGTLEWNSEGTEDGSYLILARVEYAEGSYLIGRTIFILDNIPELNVSIGLCVHIEPVYTRSHGIISSACEGSFPTYFLGESIGGAMMDVQVIATAGPSTAGIVYVESVELFIDDVSYGAIYDITSFRYLVGSWEWNVPVETHGNHELRALAILSDGRVVEVTRTVYVDNPPQLTLEEPLPGDIVGNTLVFRGAFSDDAPGAELVIKIGDLEILRTTASPFNTSFDMRGLQFGAYDTEVSLRDSGDHVFSIKPSIYFQENPEDYTRVCTIPRSGSSIHGGVLYDIDNGQLIFSSQSYFLDFYAPTVYYGYDLIFHDKDGTEINITPIFEYYYESGYRLFNEFDLSNGRIAMVRLINRVENENSDIVYWDGVSIINVSETEPINLQYESNPKLKWPWIMWYAGTGTYGYQDPQYYVLRNLETGERHQISPPDNTRITQDFDFDFDDSNVMAVFRSGGNIYLFSSSDAITRVIGEVNYAPPQIDGTTVIWRHRSELMLAETTSFASPTTLSTDVRYNSYILRDGLVAWAEGSRYNASLFVFDGLTTIQIGTNLRHWEGRLPYLYQESGLHYPMADVGGGKVVWQQLDGNVYSWNKDTGDTTLIFTIPDNPYWLESLRIDSNNLYLLLMDDAGYDPDPILPFQYPNRFERSLYKIMLP
ncbi:MAG: hypothetical protein JRI22_18225 [Deltaproteobacteria bacterium]|nr:hypothetical protein [Deltaproteobacteria bacterium]